jgi:hypothetical protein
MTIINFRNINFKNIKFIYLLKMNANYNNEFNFQSILNYIIEEQKNLNEKKNKIDNKLRSILYINQILNEFQKTKTKNNELLNELNKLKSENNQ